MEYTKDQLIQQVLGGINPHSAGPTSSQDQKKKQNKANLYLINNGNWNEDQSSYKFNSANPPPFTMDSPPPQQQQQKEKATARSLNFDNTKEDQQQPPNKPEKAPSTLPKPQQAPPPKLNYDSHPATP